MAPPPRQRAARAALNTQPRRQDAQPTTAATSVPVPMGTRETPALGKRPHVGLARVDPRQERPRANPMPTEPKPAKKRSYELQRSERNDLAQQVRELEEQLDRLRCQAGLPTREDAAAIDHVRANSEDLDECLHVNGLYLGRIDSMITKELLTPPISAISSFVHLPRDMDERRAVLRGMQELKLRRGAEVATSWLYHVDHTAPFVSEKGIEIDNGEYHYNRFEIDQFSNYTSARQLYNTFVQFRYSMEISVTDGLGQLTLREDSDDVDDPTIWNHRFVTITEELGVPEELNLVCFAQFYPHSPYTNSPMGIVVVDTVNIDDLYPYIPEERTCKDVQSIHMAYEITKPGTNEKIVVMKQCHFCVQLPPRFEVAPGVVKKLQQNFSRWPNYQAKYLHDYVVTDNDAAQAG